MGIGHRQYKCPKKGEKVAATATTTAITPHGSHNGGGPRWQPDGGARRVGTSSATASVQLYVAQTEKPRNASVVRGIVIFEPSLASILFDNGASSSFISSRYMHALGLDNGGSNVFMIIYTSLGARNMPSCICKKRCINHL